MKIVSCFQDRLLLLQDTILYAIDHECFPFNDANIKSSDVKAAFSILLNAIEFTSLVINDSPIDVYVEED